MSRLKRPFHSKAQGLQVGGRVSQLLRLAGDHLPNKDCPARCQLPLNALPRACHLRRHLRLLLDLGTAIGNQQGTGHRYRTTGKARWHCGRRSTSLILSFRQLLSPARVGRLQQRVEYQLDRFSDDFFPDFNFCLCCPPPGKYEGSGVNFLTNHFNFQFQH